MSKAQSSAERLGRKGAAAWLTEQGYAISPKTLEKMATRGGGPPYRKFNGAAVYEKAGLISWAESHPEAHTTSEHEDLVRRAGASPE